MKYKIVIPKKGKDIGVAKIEGMEQDENCQHKLQEVAVGFGGVASVTPKDHFDDDNPVFDTVSVKD